MQPADLLIDNLASLASIDADGDFGVQHQAAIAIRNGHIEAVGPREEVLRTVQLADDAEVIDARGMSAVPGLVDCHTHIVYGGNRIHEFDLRAQGADYERIAAEGGGIKASVKLTREASDETLLADATKRAGAQVIGTAPPQKARERTDWFEEQIADSGLRLDHRAVAKLGSWLGEDAGRLDGILETLKATYGTAHQLKESDVDLREVTTDERIKIGQHFSKFIDRLKQR
jgi:imidazolonepropionase-like amidohydrolase